MQAAKAKGYCIWMYFHKERSQTMLYSRVTLAAAFPVLQTAPTSLLPAPISLLPTPTLLVRPSVISTDYQQIPSESWSEQHVRDFLFDKKLDEMILLTKDMNGEELYELLRQCHPQLERWLMFDRLNKELEKRHQQTLPISVYLRFLKQTLKYSSVSLF
ncbi:unnamed protein product [Didymodactylos carnosus]|uniref:Uncharacterized protein n=1 Tax=Didymodactylos carnosus TaxID=1234261 RepID=A0A816BE00_9BILA|nr:unnamed protein product [Didymodactylos carnosus]CAF4488842.1 unnamed protein product [Didymodactylos carnosus]